MTEAPARAVQRPAGPRRRRPLLPVLLLAGLASGAYYNALDNPFVYDDYRTVQANPSLEDPTNVAWLLQYAAFRPVVNLSYAVDRVLWGRWVFGYHLTSVLLHALNAVLVYLLIRRALYDGRVVRAVPHASAYADLERPAALGAAALFVVHPLMTESVGYVSGRSELLCGLFLLAALLLARSALGAMGPIPMRPTAGRWLRAIGALACAVLALLSKEVAAALPILFVSYELLLLPADAAHRRRRALAIVVPAAVLIAMAIVYRVRALAASDAQWSSEPLLDLMTQAIVVCRYLGLLLWPVGQTIMHDVHRVTTMSDPLAWAAAAALIALAMAAWRVRQDLPIVTLGVVWFFSTIAPSSSLVRLQEGMAEHRAYIASIGVCLALGAVLARASVRLVRAGRAARPRVAAAVAVPVVVLGGLTVQRNVVWGSPIALWQEAALASPALWQPRYALGDALREAGRCDEAIAEYEASLQIHQPNPKVRLNLGICLAQLGRLDEAESTFRRVVEVDPGFARGYTNLAGVELVRGRTAEARALYAKAIEVDPANTHARLQLARLDEAAGELAAALRLCQDARRINSGLAAAIACVARLEKRLQAGGAAPQ